MADREVGHMFQGSISRAARDPLFSRRISQTEARETVRGWNCLSNKSFEFPEAFAAGRFSMGAKRLQPSDGRVRDE